MKFPFFQSPGDIPVKNLSDFPVVGSIEIRRFDTEAFVRKININLAAKAGIIISIPEVFPVSLNLISNGSLSMYPRMFLVQPSAIVIPPATPVNPDQLIKLISTPSIRQVGSDTYKYMKKNVADVFESVAASVIRDIPKTKPFLMGPACAAVGRVPGNESHVDGMFADIDIPTLTGEGTQYGGWANIWKSRDPRNMILDESLVNWEALWQFNIRIAGHCKKAPNGLFDKQQSQIVMHERLFDMIAKRIDIDKAATLNSIVTLSSGRDGQHDGHGHYKITLK